MRANPFQRQPALLVCTAAAALVVVVARAATQSITIDEADTFLSWVAPSSASHWAPASNNHLLNSMLMRLAVSLFGASQFTVRLPAIGGAILYTVASYCLCRMIARTVMRQWILLACLVFNPFILDYLVAARGYGLALGFLLCAIACTAHEDGASGNKWRAAASACLALSFAANFSFAFVDAAALLFLFLWTSSRGPRGTGVRLLTLAALPAMGVSLLFTASTLAHWPKGQLWFGASSLGETFGGIVESSFYQLNPHLANPWVFRILQLCRPAVLPLFGVLCLWQIGLIARNIRIFADPHIRRLAVFGGVAAAIFVTALSMHWLAFRLFHLLLPKERTAIFFVPLFTLMAAIAVEMTTPGVAGRCTRAGLIAVMGFTASYFLFCLRLSYFKEWKWDAEVNQVYPVLSYYNHTYGVQDVGTSWMYVAALNFYRTLSGRERFTEFSSAAPTAPPRGKAAYVLHAVLDREFLEREGLKVVYHGQLSDVVVAVRPDVLSCREGCASPCEYPWTKDTDSKRGFSATGREPRCPRPPCCLPSVRSCCGVSVLPRSSCFFNCPST
ncbi:MAG: hypothetical protein IT165_15720 [Bryobacterales bacterium]|nr:hypothetical protein [Bryobacterales bacterium]